MKWYALLLSTFGQTRVGAWSIKYLLSRIDRTIYRWSNGRIRGIAPMVFPTLLLITKGRKSGQERITPLLYLSDGDALIVGSSNVGLAQSAAWPLNVAANPDVYVQIGTTVSPYHARPGTADEIDRYWPQFAAIYPPFETYAQRTGIRKLFVLEPRT